MKLLLIFLLTICQANSAVDVHVKGIDDGIISSQDYDYRQALVNAKQKAIELAGVELESTTLSHNFMLVEDNIEMKSKGVLLPGYSVIDVGYQLDGTYLVVLSGKVSETARGESADDLYNTATLSLLKSDTVAAESLFYRIVELYPESTISAEAYTNYHKLKSNRLLDEARKMAEDGSITKARSVLKQIDQSVCPQSVLTEIRVLDKAYSLVELAKIELNNGVVGKVERGFAGNKILYDGLYMLEGDSTQYRILLEIEVKKRRGSFISQTALKVANGESLVSDEMTEFGAAPLTGGKSKAVLECNFGELGNSIKAEFQDLGGYVQYRLMVK